MFINDSDRNLISQALVLAAARYVDFALDAESMKNGERLAAQFIRQAETARTMAILIGDSMSMALGGIGHDREAKAAAERITARQMDDERNSRRESLAVVEGV